MVNNEKKMKNTFILIIFALFFGNISAQTGLIWQPVDEVNTNFPEGVRLYKTAGKVNGDTVTAYYTATDLKTGQFIFQPVLSSVSLTPQQYYTASGGAVLFVTNGGYFGGTSSYSLVMNDGKTLAPNIKGVTRTCTCGGSYTYYPTRSAFGINRNMKGEVQYVYSLGASNTTWAYPVPSPNTTAQLPQPQPSESFPAEGYVWDVSEAIGGGPLLIRNGQINLNYEPELFQTDITTSKAPRTAIGITADSILINMVVDGRQTHSVGVTLQTLANMLSELGCTDAINLDGGGSSAMFADGKLINKPSDGTQRAVPTAVTLVKVSAMIDTENPAGFSLINPNYTTSESGGFGASQTVLFNPGYEGKLAAYHFQNLESAYYRLDIWLNETLSQSSSSDVLYILDRYLIGKDTVRINQQQNGNSFVTLGNFHLGPRDSILIVNNSVLASVQADAMRLVKIGKTLPEIKLNPEVYSQNRATNEKFKLFCSIKALNGTRLIKKLNVYELIGTTKKILYQNSFDPQLSHRDSVEYTVNTTSGEIKILFTATDELNDSSTIEYKININNATPSFVFKSSSILNGEIADTLVFDMKVNPGSQTRKLKSIRVTKNPSGSPIELYSNEVNDLYAEFLLDYIIKNEDSGNLEFLFEAEDETGYVGTKKHSLQVLHVNISGGDSPKIWYSPSGNTLNIQMPPDKIRDGHFRIIDITGRELLKYPLKALAAQSVPIPSNLRGIYIVEFVSGTFSLNQKIMINP